MRILIVHPNYYGPPWSEGVANIARRLVKHLCERGHEVVVVAAGMDAHTEARRDGEFGEVIHLVAPSTDRTLRSRAGFWCSFFWRLRAVHRSFRAENALVFSTASLFYSPRVLLLRWLLGRRTCFYVSGLNRPLVAINWFRDDSRVIVGSPFLQRWFPGASLGHPVTPIHLRPRPLEGPATPGPVLQLLFLGALQKERGVGYLIEGVAAARQLTERELHLVIAINSRGEPGSIAPLAGIEALIERLGVGDIVELRGIADTNELYGEADVVIIPRQQPTKMSFPVRVLESVSFGKPLIVTTMCDMGLLVEGCGLVVDPSDPQDLARAIAQLADDPALYTKLSNGCGPALRRYAPEITLETIHARLIG